ncbi:MAG: peptidoglycan-binding domain-containing protein [Planctomycetota bacterium]
MLIRNLLAALALVSAFAVSSLPAATQEFYGRSGNAIELDFGALPGVPSGAMFDNLSLSGFNGHTVLTSSDLAQGTFASDGRLWVFPNPARDTTATGDTNTAERGFQGRLEGSIQIDGETKNFAVNVRPGYTGAGRGSVGQSGERVNRRANNPLFVAQQQHRLNYFGFVPEGGGQLVVDGIFGGNTDSAISTFQAAFIAGVNTGQSNVDGIVGPNTAGWLNAANAPTWEELIDPDPQVPGNFSLGGMMGDFDILPSRDPGTGQRTGLTPQVERWGTSWAQELWRNGSALAKAETGQTQLMNAMSTFDGYGSSFAHNTHRVGMDVDMHVNVATQNFGDGFLNRAESQLVRIATAYIDAGTNAGPNSGRFTRIISSNEDVLDAIAAVRPGIGTYFDDDGVHLSHFHWDVGAPAQVSGLADLAGDFNLDGQVDASDYLVWQRGSSPNPLSATDLNTWQANFGANVAASVVASVPEPSTLVVVLLASAALACSRVGVRH